MCQPPTIFHRLSSRASQGMVALFAPIDAKEEANHHHSAPALQNIEEENNKNQNDSIQKCYTLHINPVSLFGCFIFFLSAAFYAGIVVRILIITKPDSAAELELPRQRNHSIDSRNAVNVIQLPLPTVLPGKTVPPTTYTFEHFSSEGSHTSYDLHLPVENDLITTEDDSNAPTHKTSDDDDFENSHGEDDEIHLPAGQHLLVDIKNVDPVFLNSEERLAEAMIKLVDESKLTLLSYHCHGLVPVGVSCAGVLLESHVAFHTWPNEGVISMDLFTCGSGKLIPTLPSIQELFGVKASDEDADEPTMLWSHKLRGFREGFVPQYNFALNPLDSDLGEEILGDHDMDIKNPVVSSATTDFQTVDVYEILDPSNRRLSSYHKSLQNDGSYESLHPELFAPDLVLLLDGRIQSTRYGDAPYHESIVHPAMITHPNPKRVAVIGGGEGATVREILKHSSLEKVVMIEIDEGVVDLSTKYLPEWQDCSSIAHHDGSAEWCFDDKRADLRVEDALAYFNDNFGSSSVSGSNIEHDSDSEEQFDVVIMDCLDPNDDHPFAKVLYTDHSYLSSLYNSLTSDGILVAQVGEGAEVGDEADENGSFANRSEMIKMLGELGFKSIHVYTESHCEFGAPWTTLVAFKDVDTRKRWYRNTAEIELDLSRRILPTKNGKSSLRYFDGATMKSYQLPNRSFEDIYCNQMEKPEECVEEVRFGLGRKTEISSTYSPVFERRFAEPKINVMV